MKSNGFLCYFPYISFLHSKFFIVVGYTIHQKKKKKKNCELLINFVSCTKDDSDRKWMIPRKSQSGVIFFFCRWRCFLNIFFFFFLQKVRYIFLNNVRSHLNILPHCPLLKEVISACAFLFPKLSAYWQLREINFRRNPRFWIEISSRWYRST